MSFPEKPEVLNLTSLEERLIAPRICFMQLRELSRGGQLTIHGGVVNVRTNVNSTINALPRTLNESLTIPIKLKRRLSYKHYYLFQQIRPKKVLDAAKYLVETSELFQNEGIEIRNSWIDSIAGDVNNDWSEFVRNEGKSNNNVGICMHNSNEKCSECELAQSDDATVSVDDTDNDTWTEVNDRQSGARDTLLQEPDCTADVDKIISFAPGEGNSPLELFVDKHSEFLAFPTIFCGKSRTENKDRIVPVHYSSVCKWELRNKDRRVAECTPNIFYKLKKLQIKQIQDSASLSLRKCQRHGKKYPAGDLKCVEAANNLIHLDEGFRVLKNLRGSPPYFEKCKKNLFAMIRQLGKPTWFRSFTAAETRWTHLLKILGRLVDKEDYTDCEVNAMTWGKKSELIQKDPVTCARNFDYMVQRLISDVMKGDVKPIGEIVDYFYRVEFQQRGSPHIHSLFWVKNAPNYKVDSNERIVNFVDNYVTCQNDISSEVIDLVNLQTHRHAKTCKKKGQEICRFNFPLPPMPHTMILNPLNVENLSEEHIEVIKDNYDKIKQLLVDMKYGEDMSFENFLEKLNLTEKEYLTAVSFSLKRETLFLKRAASEIRINNNYNSILLRTWQAITWTYNTY